ncbi:4-aminobutyrate aminotransferase [Methylobacterium radiodurans]|uniref:4-aminobutyrate aminotransferase n=1 Tax=Methylobacterium radiodurans TaxID=2202828 RepID=A0A2U8VPE8_9HYPH|nr:4-aminobutyrate aminotransferase [Methylobacterium radiodurans]AWN35569.1 4-aminobutyrate aminotransferase [Methylobacterium radiodurans]
MTFARPLAALVAGGLLIAAGPVQAETVQKTETVASGKTGRLLVTPNLKKDCAEGPMPEFRFSAYPKNGAVIVKAGKQKTPASFRCPNKEAGVMGVFYQPKDGFTGSDELTFEVKSADGEVQTRVFKITVEAAAKGGDAKKDSNDL